jgi:ectoine hydroxylase-related dioxygenase (phytanoyl-CoA dioxygenase family)
LTACHEHGKLRHSLVTTPDLDLASAFERDGHVLVRGALPADWVGKMRERVDDAFARHRPKAKPLSERTAYERAFIQVVNLGERAPEIRELTHSPILGELAADLLRVDGVRLFVEDLMFKEPDGGATPWHQDASTMPFEPPLHVATVWVPLVEVGANSGRLRFVSGSHRLGLTGPVDISEETEIAFEQLIRAKNLPVTESPSMQPGDVSVHHGFTIHGALPNRTAVLREVVALHFFADGMRVADPDNEARTRLLEHLAPGLVPGDLARAPSWPLVWRRGPP